MPKGVDLVATAVSIDNVDIRITKERWEHVITRHRLEESLPEILETISKPDKIFVPPTGFPQQKLAIKKFSSLIQKGIAINLAVHYKEISTEDGFLITAFAISNKRLKRMVRKWKKVYP